jgi:hypothetical protein
MALSIIGFATAVLAATRIVGDIAEYLTLWETCLPITLLLGLGAAVFGDQRSAVPERAKAVHAVRLATPMALLVPVASIIAVVGAFTGVAVAVDQQAALPGPTRFPGYTPPLEVKQATDLVESALRPSDRVVRLTIATQSVWPTVAGVALQLERGGRRTTEFATPGYGLDAGIPFGVNRHPTGHEDVDIEFQRNGPTEVQGTPAHGHPVGSLGSLIILINRPAS